MFSLTPNSTFIAGVPLSVPGTPLPLIVNFTFKHLNKQALTAWLAAAPGKADAVLLNEIIVGWEMHDKGTPVPYEFTALEALLTNYSTAHNEVLQAYLAELSESKKKTSKK